MRPIDSGIRSAALRLCGLLSAFAGVAFLWAALAPEALAQSGAPPTVDSVTVVGLKSLTQSQITANLITRPGQPLTKGNLEQDIRTLGDMKMFIPGHIRQPEVQPVPGTNTVRVIFYVEEYPNIVREIVYKNAHHESAEELDAITGLKRGLPLNTISNHTACQNIVEHYKKEGRYFAQCFLEEGDKASDTRVVFNVNEGPIVRIGHIQFTGNEALASSARLLTQIETNPALLGIKIFGTKYLEPSMIESDALKLQEYYKGNGYRDARVTRELEFSDDHTTVNVTFHIVEGIRYHIKDIEIRGASALPTEQVASYLKAQKGDLYDDKVIRSDVRTITDLYGYRGYPAVVQCNEVEVKKKEDEPGLVRIVYQINEQRPVRVGEIYIEGNDVTKNRVILRALNIYPGQTLSYPALKQGEASLARTGLFDNSPDNKPLITLIDRPNCFDPDLKDVDVRIKETMTGSLMFGASINSDAGLVGSIVLNERNFDILRFPTSWDDFLEGRAFRGGGQDFRIEAVPGTEVQRYSVSWREPYLFDMPYSLSTQGYYYERLNNEDTETRIGMNVAVGHQLNRFWSVSAGLRLENVNISNVADYEPVDYTSVVGDNLVVAPRLTVARDDRDSVLRPTEGGKVSFTYEQLLGDYTAPILSVEASKYFTIAQRADGSGRQVIALRSLASWAGSDTPVFERFFAGGINSLRGFEYRGVGPFVNGFNVGGDFMFLNTIEYQLPILANDTVYAVAFIDSGTVEKNFAINDYRVSAGFGIRIQIPMLGPVPLALDFGFPIVRGPGDREQIFQFYFGINR